MDDKITNIYTKLANKLGKTFDIERAGGKKQHLKIVYTFEFNDFEGELASMQNVTNEFFTESCNAINLIV